MLLVGLLAVQIGGRAIWALPLAFVAMMVVGGVLGMAGVAMPFVEVVIALSVLVLGGVLALGWTPLLRWRSLPQGFSPSFMVTRTAPKCDMAYRPWAMEAGSLWRHSSYRQPDCC
jgi:hypothetical protein